MAHPGFLFPAAQLICRSRKPHPLCGDFSGSAAGANSGCGLLLAIAEQFVIAITSIELVGARIGDQQVVAGAALEVITRAGVLTGVSVAPLKTINTPIYTQLHKK